MYSNVITPALLNGGERNHIAIAVHMVGGSKFQN